MVKALHVILNVISTLLVITVCLVKALRYGKSQVFISLRCFGVAGCVLFVLMQPR